jgi:hypothetical protein
LKAWSLVKDTDARPLQPGTTTSCFGRSPPRLHAKLARDVPAWDAQCAAACPLCSSSGVQTALFKPHCSNSHAQQWSAAAPAPLLRQNKRRGCVYRIS